jgi:hemoglobin
VSDRGAPVGAPKREVTMIGPTGPARGVAIGVTALVVAGCVGFWAKASLYERLGGLPYIQIVVDDFVANVAADDRINKRFEKTNILVLKKHLIDQICQATGGPCKYTGRDMKTAHTGMKITEAEWNATVEDLVKTLDKYKVPEQEKNDLLALLGSLKADIVGI